MNTLPVSTESRKPGDMLIGLGLAAMLVAIFYFMLRGNPENMMVEKYSNYGSVGSKLVPTNAPKEFQVLEPTDISRSASSAISASSAVVLSDMNISEAKIQTPSEKDASKTDGSVIQDIKYATKGDGQIRPVAVNDKKVDSDFVKLAMFENQDFMYRLQDPPYPLPHLQDQSIGAQRRHFGKMTYPLVWQRGTLGMDVQGEKEDTRVTISFTGGRPPDIAE